MDKLVKILDDFIYKVTPEWKAMHRVADKHLKKLTDVYDNAFAKLRNSIDVESLSKEHIAMMDDKINWQIFDEACDKAYDIVGLILIEAGSEAAKYLSNSIMNRLSQSVNKAMPSIEAAEQGIKLTGLFNMRNPMAANWAASHVGENIKQINSHTRQGVQTIITDALNYGGHPYETARKIRQYIGLTEKQVKGILRYQAKLDAEGRPRAQVDRMVDARIRNRIRARANTIARTETQASACAGQQLHWEDQMNKNYLSNEYFQKEWIVTPDDRLCPICATMDGKRASIDGVFDGGYKTPPLHPNCRCSFGLVEIEGKTLAEYQASAEGQNWSAIDRMMGIGVQEMKIGVISEIWANDDESTRLYRNPGLGDISSLRSETKNINILADNSSALVGNNRHLSHDLLRSEAEKVGVKMSDDSVGFKLNMEQNTIEASGENSLEIFKKHSDDWLNSKMINLDTRVSLMYKNTNGEMVRISDSVKNILKKTESTPKPVPKPKATKPKTVKPKVDTKIIPDKPDINPAVRTSIPSSQQTAGHWGEMIQVSNDEAAAVANNIKYWESAGVQNIDADNLAKQLHTIEEFTGTDDYTTMRMAARGEKVSEEMIEKAKQLEDYIAQAPKFDDTIYRGIIVPEGSDWAKFDVGDVIDMGGASSWSSMDSVAWEFSQKIDNPTDMSIVFEVNKTNKGTSIRHLSQFEEEDEVLVSATGKYKVIRGELRGEKGSWAGQVMHITLEELP
jgi:SPP1 gp7 family putative phage head morphogenesis protein